jgi:hypothetical protein
MAFAKALNDETDAANKRRAAEAAYATAKAESVGVKVGSIIATQRKEGYGSKRKLVTRRYRVFNIGYCNYRQDELTLYAVTIRKDGTEGERHEIWQDWTLEAEV